MSIVQYHSTPPKGSNTDFKPEKDVEFELNFSGRNLLMGSVAIEADLITYEAAATVLTTKKIQLDGKIGCHGLFSNWKVTSQLQQQLELIDEYPRFVRMNADSNLSASDLLNSEYVCELRAPTDDLQALCLRQRVPRDFGNGNAFGSITKAKGERNPDFVLKPMICLNRPVVAGSQLPFRQVGTITVSGNLTRALHALYGPECASNSSYKIENVRMNFTSYPDMGEPLSPINFRSYTVIQSEIVSNLSNISSTVPSVCDGVAISYVKTDNRTDATKILRNCDTQLDRPENVKSIKFMFNDSTTDGISYEITTQEEMIYRGLQALNGNKNNDVQLQRIYANDGVIHGMYFGNAVNLATSKFNIQLSSDVTNSKAYTMFCYFNSIKQIN